MSRNAGSDPAGLIGAPTSSLDINCGEEAPDAGAEVAGFFAERRLRPSWTKTGFTPLITWPLIGPLRAI